MFWALTLGSPISSCKASGKKTDSKQTQKNSKRTQNDSKRTQFDSKWAHSIFTRSPRVICCGLIWFPSPTPPPPTPDPQTPQGIPGGRVSFSLLGFGAFRCLGWVCLGGGVGLCGVWGLVGGGVAWERGPALRNFARPSGFDSRAEVQKRGEVGFWPWFLVVQFPLPRPRKKKRRLETDSKIFKTDSKRLKWKNWLKNWGPLRTELRVPITQPCKGSYVFCCGHDVLAC